MFTGIVERVGRLVTLETLEDARVLVVEGGWQPLVEGESIAVNGVCLTVTAGSQGEQARFFVSRETLERTNLVAVRVGDAVNLERATTLDKALSGHLVQGHVDGQAHLEGVSAVGESFEVRFLLPRSLGRYCVEKGSIALNGVSLTLNKVEDLPEDPDRTRVTIMLIPHTWEHTNLSALQVGDAVNVEVDVLAKYVERLLQGYRPPTAST